MYYGNDLDNDDFVAFGTQYVLRTIDMENYKNYLFKFCHLFIEKSNYLYNHTIVQFLLSRLAHFFCLRLLQVRIGALKIFEIIFVYVFLKEKRSWAKSKFH